MVPSSPPADPPPPLEQLHCGCGYLLRGLVSEGRCPECGRAVADTVAAAEARARWVRARPEESPIVAGCADAGWLASLAAGAGGLLVADVGLLAQLVGSDAGGNPSLEVRMAVAAVGAAAVWLLARPGPPTVDGAGGRRGRAALRVLALVPLAAAVVFYLAQHVVAYYRYEPMTRVATLAWLAAPPLALLLFRRLRHLAAAMHRPGLYTLTLLAGIGAFAGACGGALAAVVVACVPLLEEHSADVLEVVARAANVVVPLLVLAGFAGTLLAVPLLLRFAHSFWSLRRHVRDRAAAIGLATRSDPAQ